jgi:hypothetical protein
MVKGFEEGLLKELRQIDKALQFFAGDRDEDGRAWIEQIDLVAQLRGLGDSAKIALAVLLCKGKALEKARTITRTGTYRVFLEKLMQGLAPEDDDGIFYPPPSQLADDWEADV